MRKQRGIVRARKSRKADKRDVVFQIGEESRFLHRLASRAAHAADANHRFGPVAIRLVQFVARKLQNRPEQADFGFANRELRCMHANRDAAGARGNVITRQSALPALIEAAF